MNTPLRLFGVDDDAPSRILLASMFRDDYEVELFDSAENCRKRLQESLPDILLLSDQLRGMGGFEFCRQLKADPATDSIPIIFLSGDDSLENRLLGYDAGGEDVIVKPYSVEEVRRRIGVVRAAVERSAALHSQMADSELLSSLLLSNMDEYAILIRFMRALNECGDEMGVADALLALLAGFRLDGAVQLRLPWRELTVSLHGEDRPLERSVMNHVRGLDRIFQFRRRCVYNYERLTLLVNDMPLEDPDACGRFRDHLAIAAEMADARLHALILAQENMRTRSGITDLLEEIRQVIDAHVRRSDAARYEGAILTGELFDELAVSFAHLGLSHELEEDIGNIIREKARGLIAVFDNGQASTAALQSLGERLERLLGQKVEKAVTHR